MDRIEQRLQSLGQSGNLRTIATVDAPAGIVDLSANDYLGIASDTDFIENFRTNLHPSHFIPTSSASRLLAGRQEEYTEFEGLLESAYGRPALLFNSGYHANTGIIQALADKQTLFLADKLVHASIIDGLNLASAAGARWMRFRHNDYNHLQRLVEAHAAGYSRVVIIVESVYSMDGDMADLDAVLAIAHTCPGAMIYVDEAHAVGVLGPQGLGVAKAHERFHDIDIVVGTLGKALAASGAYASVSPALRSYLVNTARSLIFSTSLPPVNVRWATAAFRHAMKADAARAHLKRLGERLSEILENPQSQGHIQPLIVGNPVDAVKLSRHLLENGYRVMPIRVPTVPPGTDRLRFSLSASLPLTELSGLESALQAAGVQAIKRTAGSGR